MWLRCINGSFVAKCEATLKLGHSCFSFSTRRCDLCGMYICDRHTVYREVFDGRMMHSYLFCSDCAFDFDMTQRASFYSIG